MRARTFLFFAFATSMLTACGGSTPPPEPPKAEPEPAPKAKAEAPPPAEAAPKPAEPAAPAAPAKEAEAEKCHVGWVCVKVAMEGARKVEKRENALIGDPKIEQTWSKTTDDAKGPAQFDFVPNRIVEVALKRKPNHKSEIVLRTAASTSPDKKTPETVLDTHDGDDFTYVGFVAAEKDGAFLIDIRYMK